MELCTFQSICNLPSSINRHGFLLSSNTVNLLRYRASLPLRRNMVPFLGLQSRTLRCTESSPIETVSEEAPDGSIAVKDVSPVEESVTNELSPEDNVQTESFEDDQTQTLEFLNDVKLDSESTYTYLLYGGGALVTLYLASAVIGSIESIPLLPKLLEVVGLGFTLWFTTRYLLFKKNREELSIKIEEIKEKVVGSESDR